MGGRQQLTLASLLRRRAEENLDRGYTWLDQDEEEAARITYAELHDRVLGAGSHLPHVAAYALAATLGAISGDVIGKPETAQRSARSASRPLRA